MALATDLNEFTHFVAKPARGMGMLLVQTMLFLGKLVIHLELILVETVKVNPGTTVDTLTRKEADAALIIASDPVAISQSLQLII